MVIGFVTEAQARMLHRVAEQLETRGLAEESRILHAFLEEISGQSATGPTAEAAEILSVTQQTIRNRVRTGILAGGQNATGHFSGYEGERRGQALEQRAGNLHHIGCETRCGKKARRATVPGERGRGHL